MHAKLLGKVTRSMTGGRGVRGGEGVCERGGGGGERKHDRNAREAIGQGHKEYDRGEGCEGG